MHEFTLVATINRKCQEPSLCRMTRGPGPLSQTRSRCGTCCCLSFVLFSLHPHILLSPWHQWGAQKETDRERKHSFITVSLWKKKKQAGGAAWPECCFFPSWSLYICLNWWKSLWSQRKHEKARQSKDGIYLECWTHSWIPWRRETALSSWHPQSLTSYKGNGNRRFHIWSDANDPITTIAR